MAEGIPTDLLLAPDDAADLLQELQPVLFKSRELGLKLNVPQEVVDEIHRTFSDPSDCVFHLLIEFTGRAELTPTRGAIAIALRSPEIDLPFVASTFEPDKPTELVTAIESDEEVKSKPSAKPSSSVVMLRERVKRVRGLFRSVRKSTVRCIEKCQLAVVAVVLMVAKILRFDVRQAVLEKYHKDLHKCKNSWELFGYFSLYCNYLSFDLLTQLLEKPALRKCSITKKEMAAYLSEIQRFREETTLLLYFQVVPVAGINSPPGYQKMITIHSLSRDSTLKHLEQFRMSFTGVFNLPQCAMMIQKTTASSVKVLWYSCIPSQAITLLKGNKGRFKAFRDFSVTFVEIDGEVIYQKPDDSPQVQSPVAKSVVEDKTTHEYKAKDDPLITKEVFLSCLASMECYVNLKILGHQLHHPYHNFKVSYIAYFDPKGVRILKYQLKTRSRMLEIVYRCLRETQDICPGHRILADHLEDEVDKEVLSSLLPTSLSQRYEHISESIIHAIQHNSDQHLIDLLLLHQRQEGKNQQLRDIFKGSIYEIGANAHDRTHLEYLLYRLSEVKNGLQIFYHSLRETQDSKRYHQTFADALQQEAQKSTKKQGLTLPDKKSSESELQDKPQVMKEALSYSIHRNWRQTNLLVLSRKSSLFQKRITKNCLLKRLESIEDGYLMFYRCLRETQNVCPGHRIVADDIEIEAKYLSSVAPGGDHGEEQDEPCVTKELFLSYMQYCYYDAYMLSEIFIDLLHERLPNLRMIRNEGEMQYFLYRICEREDGPQLFYRHLRQNQHSDDTFRHLADGLQREARRLSMKSSVDPASKFVSTKSKVPDIKATLSYSGNQRSFSDVPGLHLDIPASAECSTTTELTFEVVHDDYILPEGYKEMPLVSEMYKITTKCGPLPVPVTVRMEHCAVVEEEDCLIHMIAHGPPPYQFQPLPGGKFPIRESYGEIELTEFSILTTIAKKLGWRMSLSVHLFYRTNSRVSFVATRNLRSVNRSIEKRFANAIKVVEKSVSCNVRGTPVISLVIPEPPSSGGWIVEPDFEPPIIETRLIRKYREGKTPPVVNLSMRWTGRGPAVEERIKIKLEGVVSVESFFLLCSPKCELPPLSPRSYSAQPLVPASPEASPLQTPPTAQEAPLPLQRQRPSSVAGASSPEARALRRCNLTFTTDGDPEYLARLLYSKALLTTEEKERVMDQMPTHSRKLEEIFRCMERRVSTNPSHLHTLIEALSTEAALQGVAEKIRECYDEEMTRL